MMPPLTANEAAVGADRPVLTVITVCRNDLVGLRKTRSTVESQTVSAEVEHLIIDGASTDGTREWLATNDSKNLRWVSEPDSGIYDAMNKGARLARGKYVVYLNAGDWLTHPAALEGWIRIAKAECPVWGYGRAAVVDGSGAPYRRPVGIGRYSLRAHAYRRSAICHQAVFMDRELLLRLGGFSTKFGLSADYALLLTVGQLSTPSIIRSVDVAFDATGASSDPGRRIAHEKHLVRVEILQLGRVASRADGAFAFFQEGYFRARRVARKSLTAVGLSSVLGGTLGGHKSGGT